MNEEQTTEPQPEATETETDWREHARTWEARAKENLARAEANEQAAQRVAELDEAAKTELDKATERADRAEAALKAAEFQALKVSIANEHQLSPEDSELFLTGTDEESLTRQAKALAARTPKDETPRVGFAVEGLQTREAGSGDTSMDELGRSIFGL